MLPLRGNHPELCRTFPEAPTVTGVQGADERSGDRSRTGQRCEAAGLPSTFRIDPTGQYRVARMPLIERCRQLHDVRQARGEEERCRTTSPPTASARCCSSTTRRPGTTCWATTRSPSACCRSAPTETAVTTKWLVHKDAVEGVDYDLDELTHVWTETNDQDRRIVEENAFGIQSPAYEPGPYSELHEGGVIQFVDWYAHFIGPRLAEASRPTLSQRRLSS